VKKALALLLVVAAGYGIYVYAPVAEDYMAIRYAAQKLANQTEINGKIDHADVTAMRAEIKRETGIELYGADVDVRTPTSGAEVVVETKLHARLPLVGRVLVHPVTIRCEARPR